MYFCSFYIKIYIACIKTIVEHHNETDPKTGETHSSTTNRFEEWVEEFVKTANIFIKKDGSYLFYETMHEYYYNKAAFTFERNKEFIFYKSNTMEYSYDMWTTYVPSVVEGIVVYNAH